MKYIYISSATISHEKVQQKSNLPFDEYILQCRGNAVYTVKNILKTTSDLPCTAGARKASRHTNPHERQRRLSTLDGEKLRNDICLKIHNHASSRFVWKNQPKKE